MTPRRLDAPELAGIAALLADVMGTPLPVAPPPVVRVPPVPTAGEFLASVNWANAPRAGELRGSDAPG